MNVLGLSFSDHEASAALVMDGKLSTAIARERITRLKRDGIRWGGCRLDLSPRFSIALIQADCSSTISVSSFGATPIIFRQMRSISYWPEGGLDLCSRPLMAIPHHFAHACGAYYSSPFYASPFKEVAVLIVDGAGGPFGGLMKNCSGPEPEAIRQGSVVIQNLSPFEGDGSRELESFYRFNEHGRRDSEKGDRSLVWDWRCLRSCLKVDLWRLSRRRKNYGVGSLRTPHPDGAYFSMRSVRKSLGRLLDRFRQERSALESRIERWRQLTRTSNYKSELLTDFTASLATGN